MEFKEIIAVTGVSGLKRLVANRNDGLILSDLNGDNKKFYPSRVHLFSPLENISIYTDEDMITVAEVLWKMKEQSATLPPFEVGNKDEDLKNYLAAVLPNYDRERVKTGDIKKLLKWYELLKDLDIIQAPVTDLPTPTE